MEHLTPKQLETFDALLDYQEEHGYFPSIRKLGHLLGITASSVHARLSSLERDGIIERATGQPRAIRILEQATPG